MTETVRIGKTDEIPQGSVKGFVVKGNKILVANLGGQFYAIGSVCTHVGGPLEKGKLEGDVITCPWHGSKFNVTNGNVVRGPASKPEPVFKITLKGDDLQLEL